MFNSQHSHKRNVKVLEGPRYSIFPSPLKDTIAHYSTYVSHTSPSATGFDAPNAVHLHRLGTASGEEGWQVRLSNVTLRNSVQHPRPLSLWLRGSRS